MQDVADVTRLGMTNTACVIVFAAFVVVAVVVVTVATLKKNVSQIFRLKHQYIKN